MGQGALTSVAMMIAEELNVDWTRVRAVFADPNRHLRNGNEYTSMNTSGSAVVRRQHPHIMQAGASARERLKEAAALAWGVDRSTVEAKLGTLKSGTRAGTYAEFATAAAKPSRSSEEPAIKKPGEWWLLGKPLKRLDADVKSNGSAVYAIDVQVPGMVYAAVKACPVPWGTPQELRRQQRSRTAPASSPSPRSRPCPARPRTTISRTAVAVVADSWWRANTALKKIPIEWDYGPYAHMNTQTQLDTARQRLEQPGEVVAENSKPSLWIGEGSEVTAEYHRPWETHARMEPINATVSVTPERVDVWSPTQDQSDALQIAADQAGRDPEGRVRPHRFPRRRLRRQRRRRHRRHAPGHGTLEAAQAARESHLVPRGRHRPGQAAPAQRHAPDRGPAATTACRSPGRHAPCGTRKDGIERVGPATAHYAISNMPYQVPNRRHEAINARSHVPVATHRAPGTNQNGFITECFADEVAIAGGWDPLEWRLALTAGLDDWQLVLRTLKEKSGFRTDLPKGQGMGVAIVEDHGSICAACATVRVSPAGELAVEKVVIVIDSGHVINPHNAAEQLEGGVCWELSHAWMGGLEMQEGRFVNTNFDSYPLLRMHQMPRGRGALRALGRGEVGRHRRAGRPAGAAGGGECHLLRDRQAHPVDAVQESRPELELKRELDPAQCAPARQILPIRTRTNRTTTMTPTIPLGP